MSRRAFVTLKARLADKSTKMFFSSLHFVIVNSSYWNINLKPKQVKCLEAVYNGKTLLPYCRQDTESPLSSIFFHRSCSTNWTVDNRQLPSGFVRLSSSFRRWTRWSAIRLGGALEEKSNPPSSASDETRAVLIYKSIILATPIHHHSKKQNTTSYLCPAFDRFSCFFQVSNFQNSRKCHCKQDVR